MKPKYIKCPLCGILRNREIKNNPCVICEDRAKLQKIKKSPNHQQQVEAYRIYQQKRRAEKEAEKLLT